MNMRKFVLSSSSHRLSRYQQFKDFQRRILVATNLFGRGMDIERVNIVFNYDMPEDSDTYLHRVSLAMKHFYLFYILQKISCKLLTINMQAFDPLKVWLDSLCCCSLGRPCWKIRDQRLGHHLCVRWGWCEDPEWCSGPLRGQRSRAARGDWYLLLQ